VMTDTAGAGGGPLRSESARRLTPEIRQSKFPGTPRPSVTLALAAPGPPVQLRWTTLRVQGPTLRDAALANGGDGSPPVARGLLPQPIFKSRRSAPPFRVFPVSTLPRSRVVRRRRRQPSFPLPGGRGPG